jgi:hypothetical protein
MKVWAECKKARNNLDNILAKDGGKIGKRNEERKEVRKKKEGERKYLKEKCMWK